jgi:hypothetical protein
MTDTFAWAAVLYCVLFVLALVPFAFANPRVMLQDYPKEIQQAVPPKTDTEKKQMIFLAMPVLLVMIGYPAFVSWYYRPPEATFLYFLEVSWGIMLVGNIFDLLILDWLMFCTITPRFVIIKGTEGNPGYKNYLFHFIGFLKGIVITFVISVATSAFIKYIVLCFVSPPCCSSCLY